MMKKYGLSIDHPSEAVFASGYFECVEYCRTGIGAPETYEEIKSEVKQLAELSKKYGVAVRSFHLPFGRSEYRPFVPASLEPAERERTLAWTKELIEIVRETGIRYVVIHGSLRIPPEERVARLDAFVEYLKVLCDYCEGLGITVCVETLKPRCIGNGLREHLYIMENVNRPNLGICFDSNHLLEEDNLNFLENAGQYVKTTHLSDFDGVDERHWFPGRGINDWKKICEILERKGYDQPYTFEVSFEDKTPTRDQLDALMREWQAIFAAEDKK